MKSKHNEYIYRYLVIYVYWIYLNTKIKLSKLSPWKGVRISNCNTPRLRPSAIKLTVVYSISKYNNNIFEVSRIPSNLIERFLWQLLPVSYKYNWHKSTHKPYWLNLCCKDKSVKHLLQGHHFNVIVFLICHYSRAVTVLDVLVNYSGTL